MELFTSSEVAKINNINNHTNDFKLGDHLQAMVVAINDTTKIGTPVNAKEASRALTVSGVVTHGETVTVNNPAVAGIDVYEFLTDDAQIPTAPTNIPVDVSANTVKATGTLTIDTQPSSADTMTIGTKVYIFVPVGTANADGEISIGTDLATVQVAIVAAINGTDTVNTANPSVTAGDFAANASTITALRGGVTGNSVATTETFAAGTNIFAAATLGSGADCTATNACVALGATGTASDTQAVNIYKSSTSDVVTFKSDVFGVVGNAIAIAETMVNGVFTAGATTLGLGVDGTIGTVNETKVDASYFYVCVADNTIAGENWRRIALGSKY